MVYITTPVISPEYFEALKLHNRAMDRMCSAVPGSAEEAIAVIEFKVSSANVCRLRHSHLEPRT
jgi:hypothetical protein